SPPLSRGGQAPTARAAGGVHARECREGEGRGRPQDRQRALEVGLLGGRVLDAAVVRPGEVVDAASVEEAWCEEGARDPGGEDRTDGLPPVAEADRIPRQEVPGVLSDDVLSLASVAQTKTPWRGNDMTG